MGGLSGPRRASVRLRGKFLCGAKIGQWRRTECSETYEWEWQLAYLPFEPDVKTSSTVGQEIAVQDLIQGKRALARK